MERRVNCPERRRLEDVVPITRDEDDDETSGDGEVTLALGRRRRGVPEAPGVVDAAPRGGRGEGVTPAWRPTGTRWARERRFRRRPAASGPPTGGGGGGFIDEEGAEFAPPRLRPRVAPPLAPIAPPRPRAAAADPDKSLGLGMI